MQGATDGVLTLQILSLTLYPDSDSVSSDGNCGLRGMPGPDTADATHCLVLATITYRQALASVTMVQTGQQFRKPPCGGLFVV